MRVREATSDDFEEIARLTVAAYRALDTWVGDDYAAHLADVAARAGAENTMVLVAEDEADGRILGSVTLTLGADIFEGARRTLYGQFDRNDRVTFTTTWRF